MRTIEEIQAEWRKALEEHEEAVQEYAPFLMNTSLSPGQNPIPISYDDLKAASDRLKKANEWLDRIRKEYLETVRAQN